MFKAMAVTTNPIPVKTAMAMLGHRVGGFRLPMIEASEEEKAVDPRRARATRPAERGLSGTLRVLPLGGLGEIGKNMAVVEYEGRIVVVDTGLMFPTPDQLGVDLVLPDFSYLRERAADIEAIVLTHGHEDHVGALPFVLREIGDVGDPRHLRRRADGRDGAVEARRAQAARHAAARGRAGRPGRARAVHDGAGQARALDPGHVRHRARVRARHHVLHRRLQVRPDARWTACRRTSRAWRSSAGRGCCSCAATRRTPTGPGMAPSESSVGPHLEEVFTRIRGRIVITSLRLEHPPRPAGGRRGPGDRAQGRARRPVDAQVREHRPASSATSTCRRGCSSSSARSTTSRTTGS